MSMQTHAHTSMYKLVQYDLMALPLCYWLMPFFTLRRRSQGQVGLD